MSMFAFYANNASVSQGRGSCRLAHHQLVPHRADHLGSGARQVARDHRDREVERMAGELVEELRDQAETLEVPLDDLLTMIKGAR